MAWVAIDRAVKAIAEFPAATSRGMLPHLSALRERIHTEVCERGFNPRVGAFTQSYGSELLDASVLLIPHVGFLPGSDPRVQGTVAAIESDLLRDGFVLRYGTEHGDRRAAGHGGRLPRLLVLAGRQLRLRGPDRRGGGAVRAAPRPAQPPWAAGRGVRPQASAADRELPAGLLAPRAHLQRPGARGRQPEGGDARAGRGGRGGPPLRLRPGVGGRPATAPSAARQ